MSDNRNNTQKPSENSNAIKPRATAPTPRTTTSTPRTTTSTPRTTTSTPRTTTSTSRATTPTPRATTSTPRATTPERKTVAQSSVAGDPLSQKKDDRAATATAATVSHSAQKEKIKEKKSRPVREAVVAGEEQINKRVVLIVGLSVAIAALLFFSLMLGLRGCMAATSKEVFANQYAATTKVGYGVTYDKTISRKLPASTDNGGLELGYPVYGRALPGAGDALEYRLKLINEANTLCTVNTRNAGSGGGYNRMDKDGNLYLNDTPVNVGANKGKLYKHSAAEGMYRGNVSDDEPAIVKTVTMRPRSYMQGYGVTGVYAPAGEVITLEISKADMDATQGLIVHIGQALYNRKANNIWTARSVNRMPVILNTFYVTAQTATLDPERDVYVAYIGSYLGGPIYIQNESVTFTVTLSGGVRYSHFILGYTTPEEFAENAKSSAPYFDLEVWDRGVLHSGPKVHAQNFLYDELYDAAVLWEKISLVSTNIKNGSNQGIVFLYDPFVAAGAAVAFPSQGAVNCPDGWMSSSLNYMSFVTGGAWGNMHEYNHNFQGGWGLPGGGEVTNNALSLVSYSLFTKISAARRMGNYGAEGTSGWNRYTNAAWTTRQVSGSRENDLSIYAALLHTFGQDNFMQSTKAGGIDGYFQKWADLTHNDMTYFSKMVGKNMSENALTAMAQCEYPAFVPLSCVYQTGRSYMYDGQMRYSSAMQPYSIKYGEDFTVDLTAYTVNDSGQYLSGSLVAPQDVTLTVKNVSSPKYGKLIKQANEMYVYKPDKNHLRSGPIYVTVQINDGTVQKDGVTYKADDVQLVLEFEQSHEMNKHMLTRTTYSYDSAVYATAKEAYEAHYAGYTQMTDGDNINSTQNSNTDIWLASLDVGTVMEVRGKIYVDESSKYRLALRGRGSVALYYSVDNENDYKLACEYAGNKTGAGFMSGNDYNIEFPFVDLELSSSNWVYFKEVMLYPDAGGRTPYIGLGWGKFTPAQGTIVGENPDGTPIIEGGTEETISVGYATAYRESYEFTHEFTSDYFYTRTYPYTYTAPISAAGTVVESIGNSTDYPIENIFDENVDNYCSSIGVVDANAPWSLTVDLGKAVAATRCEIQGNMFNSAKNQAPSTFALYAGMTQDGMEEVASFTNASAPNGLSAFYFSEEKTFRFYRLTVTKTVEGRFLAIKSIRFMWSATASQLSPDDKTVAFKGNWQSKQALSSFGHVNLGAKGATAELTFVGKRFGILSSDAFGSDFTVKIDGKKVASDSVLGTASAALPVYLSPILTDKKHTVTITCKKASDIDSVLLWKSEK